MKTNSTERTRKHRALHPYRAEERRIARQTAVDLHLEAECYGITMHVEGKGIRLDGPVEMQARFFTRISAIVPELLPVVRDAEELAIKRAKFMQAVVSGERETEDVAIIFVHPIKDDAPEIIEVDAEELVLLERFERPAKVEPDDLRDNCDRESTAFKDITYDLKDELMVDEITHRIGTRSVVYCANANEHNRLRCSANGKTISAVSRRGDAKEGYWLALFRDVEPHSIFNLRLEGQRARFSHEHDQPVNNKTTDRQRHLLRRLGVPENKIPKTKKRATRLIGQLKDPSGV